MGTGEQGYFELANSQSGGYYDELRYPLKGGVNMSKIGTIKKMTPGRAIRTFCVSCCGGDSREVKSCDGDGKDPAFDACPFHPYRMGRGRPSVKIIRKFCLHCMGGIPSLVRECDTVDCNCHPYRTGKNPARAGIGSKDTDRLRSIHPTKDAVRREKGVYFERSALG